ncbi:MAG: DEAD/DEAH box helicase [Bacillota bacterium]
MSVIGSNEQLVERVNEQLTHKQHSSVKIINDKLTLSVFSELHDSIAKVKDINIIIRDTNYLPTGRDVAREFEISRNHAASMLVNAYEITEKNKLGHFSKARKMYEFIERYVKVRRISSSGLVKSNMLLLDDDYAVFGDSSLEHTGVLRRNALPAMNFNIELTDRGQISQFVRGFDMLWNDSRYSSDYKKELLESLKFIYKEHGPEFLYYFTLYELFGNKIDESVERFESDKIGFKKTSVWNMLFKFQREAVVAAVIKIEKHNGCIIADSVGLGKTFEALAVIKYYELRMHKVLVLTPAKLFENWNTYRYDYVDNPLAKDRFAYDIICHTDLSRTAGLSRSGIDLSRVNWGNYDLVVIDESHNFRNRIENPNTANRYDKLMNELVLKGVKTKVLLLSATPVNNSLRDLRNQISLITVDDDQAFIDAGINSVRGLLNKTQTQINVWNEQGHKRKEDLLNVLPSEFYKLLDMVTISRSRKHVTQFFGEDSVGKFPQKLKPQTYNPDIDTQEELLRFGKTNEDLELLSLAVYSPLSYIKPQYKAYYREKYQTRSNGKVLFNHEDREQISKILHRFNIFKRMESSIYSFAETIRRLVGKIDTFITALSRVNSEVELETNDEEHEDEYLDYKYEINTAHLMVEDYLRDLMLDRIILARILQDAEKILSEKRDKKIQELREIITTKISNQPYNSGNRKVLVFTAFAETAKYLFDELSGAVTKRGVHCAMITGSDSPRTTNKTIKAEFNRVIQHFSPRSKGAPDMPREQQIDVLFATDCISEGQNLQDCDCVINYDIHWNPVVLIQRFGRIDRIGSINEKIAMINFFPHMELNDYLKLEQRIKGKMTAVNVTATGDEDLLTPENNDMSFRKTQLERLQNEIVELEDFDDNLSLTDMNMNDYLFELSSYVKNNPDIRRAPRGIYSAVFGQQPGCIFCFKHLRDDSKPKSESSIYPYYIIYVGDDGAIVHDQGSTREALQEWRKLAYGKADAEREMLARFNALTGNATDMKHYSTLLNKAVTAIKGVETESAIQSVFDFGGFDNPFADNNADDFELISFLVVGGENAGNT